MTKTFSVELTAPQIKALLQVLEPDIDALLSGKVKPVNTKAFKNALDELRRAERKATFNP